MIDLGFFFPEAISEAPLNEVWIVGDNPDPVYTSAYVWHRDAAGAVTSGFLPEPALERPDGSLFTRTSGASDVNEFGDVVGVALAAVGWWTEDGEPRDTESHAMLWTLNDQGQYDFADLDPSGLFGTSSGQAINNSQTVVGKCTGGAFVWTPALGMQDLNAFLSAADADAWYLTHPQSINDDNIISGHGYYDGVARGFILDLGNDTLTRVPLIAGAESNACMAINEQRHVTGWAQMADGTTHAFFWEGPGYDPVDLGRMGHDGAAGFSLNTCRQVVGFSHYADPDRMGVRSVATLWKSDGQSWSGTALETLIPPASKKEPTWELDQARGINDDGWIVGYGSKVSKWQNTSAGFLLIPN